MTTRANQSAATLARALDILQRRISEGEEFPDACSRTAIGVGCDYDDLRAAYDLADNERQGRLTAAHEAGYEANHEGALLRDNPHAADTAEYRAWEAGHLQAQSVRREWEQSNG